MNIRTAAMQLVQRFGIGALLGLSHSGARDLYVQFGYPKDPQVDQLLGYYLRNPMANRIVRAYPSATWRQTPVVRDEQGDSSEQDGEGYSEFVEAFETLEENTRLISHLERADRLAGIGQYGVLLMGFRDGKPLSEPLEDGNFPLLYLQAFNQRALSVQRWDVDEKSPRFGRPETYNIQTGQSLMPGQQGQSRSILVHYSRLVHIAEFLDENEVFGTPRLLPILNSLMDLEKVIGAGSETYWLNARQGLALEANPEADFTPEAKAEMKEQIQDFENQLSRVIAMQGVKASPLNAAVSDPGPNIDRIMDQIAGGSGIPKRILLGTERGELSSEQDENNWADRIHERRLNFAGPLILKPVVQKLIRTQNLPEPQGSWWIEWPESAMSPMKAAELGRVRAQTLQSYVQSPGAEIIVPPEEFRKEMMGLEPTSDYDSLIAEYDELMQTLPAEGEQPEPTEEPTEDDPEVKAQFKRHKVKLNGKMKVNAQPRTLYVYRPVKNWQDIAKWAKEQGLKTSLGDDMHVTICYSKKAVDWMKMGSDTWSYGAEGSGELVIPEGGPRVVEPLGPEGAIVLHVSSTPLQWRHGDFIARGATYPHQEYQPHITVTYDPGDVDLKTIEPYRGKIVLGPECFEEINSEWDKNLKEVANARGDVRERARGNGKGKRAAAKPKSVRGAGRAQRRAASVGAKPKGARGARPS